VDSARPIAEQVALLRCVLAAHRGLTLALEVGASLDRALTAPVLGELRRAKEWKGAGVAGRLQDLEARLARLEVPPEPAGVVTA
jgi:hypothetical protein